jgi:hypothetical protein
MSRDTGPSEDRRNMQSGEVTVDDPAADLEDEAVLEIGLYSMRIV